MEKKWVAICMGPDTMVFGPFESPQETADWLNADLARFNCDNEHVVADIIEPDIR